MPATGWAKLESNVFDATILTSAIEGISTTIGLAKDVLEVAKVTTQTGVGSLVVNPIDTAINVVGEALETATQAFNLEGGVHVLFVPAADVSTGDLLESISKTLNNVSDLNRPDFAAGEYAAGGMFLGTANEYAAIVQSAERLAKMSRNPNRAVTPIRMALDGAPEYCLRSPQNVTAAPFVKSKSPAVRVLWDPERNLGTTARQVDAPKEKFKISKSYIVRTTAPLINSAYDPGTFPEGYVITEQAFPGYEKPNTFVDTDVESGTDYYYGVAYSYSDENDVEVGPYSVSNLAWVQPSQTPKHPLTFQAPYWISVDGGLNALYPDLTDVTEYINRFIQGYLDVASSRVSGADDAVGDFIDSEITRLSGYEGELNAMSSKLEAVAAPWPAGSLGAFAFHTGGSHQEILAEISGKLYDTADPNTPDVTRGYSMALILLASSATAAAAETAYGLISLLMAGNVPEPDPGLDASIASIGTGIESLVEQIMTQFGPDMADTGATIEEAAASPPNLLELP